MPVEEGQVAKSEQRPAGDPSVEAVSRSWKNHWDESGMRPDLSLRGRLLRRYVTTVGFSGGRYVMKILDRHIGGISGKRVLDAGAGTGLWSLPLARRGAEVTLLDIAPAALEIARAYYAEQDQSATFIEGSIFEMPFPDDEFDVVWNTGVIEHFEPEQRAAAVREMLRTARPDGIVITLNPSARAGIYNFAKRQAERRGTWNVGFELPIESLRDDVDLGAYELEEVREGWFMQLHFLKYLLPKPLRIPYAALHELAQTVLNPLNRFPGYLLTSVIRKKETPSRPASSDGNFA
jgi:2-polyprenyl-3-methyl-5-hydroxy-6-metoxy-1,4-benzoquinol methylase